MKIHWRTRAGIASIIQYLRQNIKDTYFMSITPDSGFQLIIKDYMGQTFSLYLMPESQSNPG